MKKNILSRSLFCLLPLLSIASCTVNEKVTGGKDDEVVLNEINGYLQYGYYPQSNINDQELLGKLNSLSGPNSHGHYSLDGNLYVKTVAPEQGSYAKSNGLQRKFHNGTIAETGQTYWFLVEPIRWNILEKQNGEYTVMADQILDVHEFYGSKEMRSIGGKDVYPNNYEYSDVRAWLNGDFLNQAFAYGKSHLRKTIVGNSSDTVGTGVTYAGKDTEETIYLPSYKELLNPSYRFSGDMGADTERKRLVSDWAILQGAYCEKDWAGCYCTRSASNAQTEEPTFYYVYMVINDGRLYSGLYVDEASAGGVDYSGIVPCAHIKA